MGDYESAQDDSFSQQMLDHPHYTRPADFEGMKVPEVLLSGHHENIRRWKYEESLKRTAARRPDLLKEIELTEENTKFMREPNAGEGI